MSEEPRLVELTRAIDNTALTAYMECPKKFEYSMILHRRSSGPPSPAIAYGAAFHHALEMHYKSNGDIDAVIEHVFARWEPHGRPDDHRTLERVILEYQNYVEKYGLPSEERGKTVGEGDSALVELSVNVTWPGSLWPYAGKIDRIFEESQFYVQDHKTTSQMGAYYFRQFDLSNQMMGYAKIAGELLGHPVAGVQINGHAVYKKESKFEREYITFSRDRLDDWAENYNRWIERIQASLRNNDFPRNFNACAGKYGQCPYASVCSVSPRLRERVLETDFEVREWNPLNAADLDAAEEVS